MSARDGAGGGIVLIVDNVVQHQVQPGLLVPVEVEEVGAPLVPGVGQPGRGAVDDLAGLERVELLQAGVIVLLIIIPALKQRVVLQVELLVQLQVVEGVAGLVRIGLQMGTIDIELVLLEE